MTTDDDETRRLRDALDQVERRLGGTGLGRMFDREGRAISFSEWGVLWSDKSYQVLDQCYTLNGAWVSTVWLGIDHSFSRKGTPVIFETMVWHDGGDTTQERYSTEADAREGHALIVERFGGRDLMRMRKDEPPNFPRQLLDERSDDE